MRTTSTYALNDGVVPKGYIKPSANTNAIFTHTGKKINNVTESLLRVTSPYVSQNMIANLIYLPEWLKWADNPLDLRKTFIAVFESHPTSISGIKLGKTVETEDVPFGESQNRKVVTSIKNEAQDVTYSIPEIAGGSIGKFLDYLITWGIGQSESVRQPKITMTANYKNSGVYWTDEMHQFGNIFYEPDTTLTRVVHAALIVGQTVTTTGDIELKRELENKGELKTIEVATGGILIRSDKVTALAEKLLANSRVGNLDVASVEIPTDMSTIETDVNDFRTA